MDESQIVKDKTLHSLRDAIPESDSLKERAAHYLPFPPSSSTPPALSSTSTRPLTSSATKPNHWNSTATASVYPSSNASTRPVAWKTLQNLVNTMLIKGEAGEIEGEVGEPSGRKTTVVVRGTPLLDGDERTIGAIAKI